MEAICSSFPPVCSPECRVLLLGSMPGVASLRARQYYAHPRNAFWPILYALWDQPIPDACYERRLAFALARRVAIWDVAQTCRREGSSDASIRDTVPNDFAALFAACPDIHTIFFNGRSAQTLFVRLAMETASGRALRPLPSTSPAYTISFDQKLAAWRTLRETANQEKRTC